VKFGTVFKSQKTYTEDEFVYIAGVLQS